jgi:hypothetical protein
MTRRALGILIGVGGLYVASLGFLTGVVVERIRFDWQRAALLQHLATTQERLHTHLMALERRSSFPDSAAIAEPTGGQ